MYFLYHRPLWGASRRAANGVLRCANGNESSVYGFIVCPPGWAGRRSITWPIQYAMPAFRIAPGNIVTDASSP